MYGHRDADPPSSTPTPSRSSNASPAPGPVFPANPRRQSGLAPTLPPHMQGYAPSSSSHQRRGSVADNVADMMGPQGTEALGIIRGFSERAEDLMDTLARPLRPYLPGVGRFLIVVTFLEDALRILTQITGPSARRSGPRCPLTLLQTKTTISRSIAASPGASRTRSSTLMSSYVRALAQMARTRLTDAGQVMITCSFLVIAKRYPEAATGGLLTVVIAQGFGYGLIFDLNFFLRNLSVVGGLLMVLSDSLSVKKTIWAGLPTIDINEADRKKYFQLAGRVLLVFLFLGFVFNGKFTLARALVSVVGLAACVMVAVGFKAKWSALFLVTTLSIFNLFINNWWSVHAAHPQRDFLKYVPPSRRASLTAQVRLFPDALHRRRAFAARQHGTR